MSKALELYQEAVLFKRDYPSAWRKVSSLAQRLGNYRLALEAAQSLQKQLDPETDPWWLATALADEGDALKTLGHSKIALEKYLQTQTILAKLAELDPNHTEWQRDLSVSYDRVGDMHLRNGDNNAALKAYQESLAIRKKLAELDPNHTEWQRDLSVSHNKVGDMHLRNGDNNAALKAYQDGLAIAKKLAELDPNVVEWQTDLVVSYYKLAQIQEDKQKELLRDALQILQKLHSESKLNHDQQGWIAAIENILTGQTTIPKTGFFLWRWLQRIKHLFSD